VRESAQDAQARGAIAKTIDAHSTLVTALAIMRQRVAPRSLFTSSRGRLYLTLAERSA
jgi:hypothetical protein